MKANLNTVKKRKFKSIFTWGKKIDERMIPKALSLKILIKQMKYDFHK